jgi:two-component system, OmpR family, response regulator ChvI
LLVDDEQDITFALTIGLEDNGFAVDAFNDPLVALQSFKEKWKDKEEKPYDLGLIDVKMPKMNGFELYNQIRKIDDRIKVCFITAFDIQKDEYFDSFVIPRDKDKPTIIRKPIAIDELVKIARKEIPNS